MAFLSFNIYEIWKSLHSFFICTTFQLCQNWGCNCRVLRYFYIFCKPVSSFFMSLLLLINSVFPYSYVTFFFIAAPSHEIYFRLFFQSFLFGFLSIYWTLYSVVSFRMKHFWVQLLKFPSGLLFFLSFFLRAVAKLLSRHEEYTLTSHTLNWHSDVQPVQGGDGDKICIRMLGQGKKQNREEKENKEEGKWPAWCSAMERVLPQTEIIETFWSTVAQFPPHNVLRYKGKRKSRAK